MNSKQIVLTLGAALVVLGSASLGFAQSTTTDKLISSREVTLPVNISPATLHLSQADYSVPVVKVLVPELAAETLMNHRNTKEGAPCLATTDTKDANDIIKNNPAIEQIVFQIDLIKSVSPDLDNKVCHVWLTEKLHAVIRGAKFDHARDSALPDRSLEDCQ
jgi:hypothetical protein